MLPHRQEVACPFHSQNALRIPIIATDNDLKITSWNKAAAEIYGWTEVEAIGQQIDELLKTEWFAEPQSSAQASIAHTGHWRGELRQRDKAGG